MVNIILLSITMRTKASELRRWRKKNSIELIIIKIYVLNDN